MLGAPANKKSAFVNLRHLFLHGDRVKMLAQGFLDLFFDAAPHLEYFSNFFELSTTQPSEIIAKLIPKTFFHVTEMRFSKKIISKTLFHVIL